MLEITRLNEITFDDFKKTIDNVIKEKIFIKNGIQKNIPHLEVEEQLGGINYLIFNSTSKHFLIKTIHNIEWTPVKLYDTAYYMVNLYNKFWLISHNTYNGFVVKYNLTTKDYILYLFNFIKNNKHDSLPSIYYPTNYELYFAFDFIKKNNMPYILIKQMTFPNSTIKINHYFIKIDEKIYYFPVSTDYVYKPILYSIIS
jgi:hypothetical protein